MNVVDSSGWIAYLTGGPHAAFFADPIEGGDPLIVPSLSLVAAAMRGGTVVDFDASLALEAAELSVEAGLALADSVMLATARAHRGLLWTQDSDFQGMDDVRFRPKVGS